MLTEKEILIEQEKLKIEQERLTLNRKRFDAEKEFYQKAAKLDKVLSSSGTVKTMTATLFCIVSLFIGVLLGSTWESYKREKAKSLRLRETMNRIMTDELHVNDVDIKAIPIIRGTNGTKRAVSVLVIQ